MKSSRFDLSFSYKIRAMLTKRYAHCKAKVKVIVIIKRFFCMYINEGLESEAYSKYFYHSGFLMLVQQLP